MASATSPAVRLAYQIMEAPLRLSRYVIIIGDQRVDAIRSWYGACQRLTTDPATLSHVFRQVSRRLPRMVAYEVLERRGRPARYAAFAVYDATRTDVVSGHACRSRRTQRACRMPLLDVQAIRFATDPPGAVPHHLARRPGDDRTEVFGRSHDIRDPLSAGRFDRPGQGDAQRT